MGVSGDHQGLMTAKQPLTPEDFAAALAAIDVGAAQKIAVAVSGGGDSMALALLLQDWAKPRGVELRAFTVDHRLRPEAADEARHVHAVLTARGVRHDILTWDGAKPATHIQERAREARYDLLVKACQRHDIKTLAVAQNREDQIETFWMRLAHGSGLDGLSGIEEARETNGIKIIRPLLGFSRARLRATCEDFGVQWIEDPSNKCGKYLRVKLRAFEDALAAEGLTPERLARTLGKLADAKEALQFYAAQAFASAVTTDADGASLDIEKWKQYPRDIQRRVLGLSLGAVAPQPYPAGFDKTERARRHLLEDGFKGQTLAGCIIGRNKNNVVRIARENIMTRNSPEIRSENPPEIMPRRETA